MVSVTADDEDNVDDNILCFKMFLKMFHLVKFNK